MSRIGKKPVAIPSGVKVEKSGRKVKVTGPKGTLEMEHHPWIEVKVEGDEVQIMVI